MRSSFGTPPCPADHPAEGLVALRRVHVQRALAGQPLCDRKSDAAYGKSGNEGRNVKPRGDVARQGAQQETRGHADKGHPGSHRCKVDRGNHGHHVGHGLGRQVDASDIDGEGQAERHDEERHDVACEAHEVLRLEKAGIGHADDGDEHRERDPGQVRFEALYVHLILRSCNAGGHRGRASRQARNRTVSGSCHP